MNIEDRLRSHLHATPEPDLGPGPSAGSIVVAGRRRQRRRQVGSVVAGALVAVGLIGGLATLLDDDASGPSEFASTESTAEDAASAAAESEESAATDEAAIPQDDRAESLPQDGAIIETMPAIAPERIVGVEGGFAGLRKDESTGAMLFITSPDGETWNETPTTGLDPDGFLLGFAHHGGTFVALLEQFDGSGSVVRLGISTDGVAWELRDLDAGESEDEAPFYSGLALGPAGVLTLAIVESTQAETGGTRSVAVSGPIDEPFTIAPLDIELNGVESAGVGGDGFAITGFTFDDRVVLGSADGAAWVIEERVPVIGSAATVAVVGDRVVSVVSADGGVEIDGRLVPLDPSLVQVWGLQAAAGEGGTAILVSGELASSDRIDVLLFSADGVEWVELGLPASVGPDTDVRLSAVGDDEVLLEVFGADGLTRERVPLDAMGAAGDS